MASRALLEIAPEMMGSPRKDATVATWPASGGGPPVAGLASIGNAIEQAAEKLDGKGGAGLRARHLCFAYIAHRHLHYPSAVEPCGYLARSYGRAVTVTA